MGGIFVDTSGWAAVQDRTAPAHAEASALYELASGLGDSIVTTNYVLTELVALLTARFKVPRPALISLVADLRRSAVVEVVYVDRVLDDAAWELLATRPDKSWSLVDCASFVVMAQRGITEALTTDHHFEQAGFRRLLES
jgi:predicted nucleic acid-binding protein